MVSVASRVHPTLVLVRAPPATALVLGAGEGERDADDSQSDDATSIDDDFHEEIDTPPIESTDEHEPPPSTSDF